MLFNHLHDSSVQVMEKLRQMIRPDQFIMLKVVKSTLEFIRFEGELENKNLVKVVISRLDAKTIKLSGFPEQLKGMIVSMCLLR